MKRDTGNLSARQRLALPIIAAEPTIEGVAEKIGVTRKTVYEWLKEEPFKRALDEARKEYVENGFRTLRLAAKRAAESIIEFGLKALEHENLEKRIAALEERIKQQG